MLVFCFITGTVSVIGAVSSETIISICHSQVEELLIGTLKSPLTEVEAQRKTRGYNNPRNSPRGRQEKAAAGEGRHRPWSGERELKGRVKYKDRRQESTSKSTRNIQVQASIKF